MRPEKERGGLWRLRCNHQGAGFCTSVVWYKTGYYYCGKGIANGYPFSGVLISEIFKPRKGMLGTTFGGNHLGCAAALAVIEVMKKEKLIENADKLGGDFIHRLRALKSPLIKEVRGRGLMIGIEFSVPVSSVRYSLLSTYHIFTGYSGTNVLRILPPLCVSKADVDYFIESFAACLHEIEYKESKSASDR